MATATKKTAKAKAPAKKAAKKAPKKAVAKSGAFAVIVTGGKQYLVRAGDTIQIEKMTGEWKAGDTVTFDQVLLVDDGTAMKLGAPAIAGAKVTGEFVTGGRMKKIDVIKYQPKSRYYKKRGHRQPFAKVKITNI